MAAVQGAQVDAAAAGFLVEVVALTVEVFHAGGADHDDPGVGQLPVAGQQLLLSPLGGLGQTGGTGAGRAKLCADVIASTPTA